MSNGSGTAAPGTASGRRGKGTCFVIMGFGKKTDFESGRTLDLDKSYKNVIKPAVEAAGLVCIRADEIVHSGLIDVPMYEQLLDADIVIADLSTFNRNALYELGVRHALRPYTTVVIAEDGIKTFPFDVNHVVVRQYRHLGEDIGYEEALRFQRLLTDAINAVLSQTPPAKDSPVYSFIAELTPPARAAAIAQANLQAGLVSVERGPASAAPATTGAADQQTRDADTHSALMRAAAAAHARGDFTSAKALFRTALNRMTKNGVITADGVYVVQRLALVTYKSKQPSEKEALKEAASLLVQLEPATCNDTETLGLWGAVHKRLWQLTAEPSTLDEAIRSYERGFYLRNDYYNGINFAFLLNTRASHAANRAEAIADFVQARRVRREVISISQQWLSSNPPPQVAGERALAQYNETKYWVLATIGESLLGLDDPTYRAVLDAAFALPVEQWMRDSTGEQITKLQQLLLDSPLRYINPDEG
jgi:tetratricopeptide (TPR) repeat protein